MKYDIEFGNFSGSKWVNTFVLSCDTFDKAKAYLISVSDELKNDNDYHLKENTNVRMVVAESNPLKIIHYITATFPNVSLSSQELI